jgi:large subunit ribosomal protein L18
MPKVVLRKNNREKRKLRVRRKVFGTSDKPRLVVNRSNKYIYAQIVNDESGKTLISTGKDVFDIHKGKKKTEAAYEVGKALAEVARKKKIKSVVFDRKGYRYHGRVKSLAEGAREGGLEF